MQPEKCSLSFRRSWKILTIASFLSARTESWLTAFQQTGSHVISCQEQHGEELPYQDIGGVSHKCMSHTSGLHHCLCPFQSITHPTNLSLSHPPPDFNLSFSLSCLSSSFHSLIKMEPQMLLTVQILFT